MSDGIWALLIGLVLIYETITLLIPKRGDTLSEKFWRLSCNQKWRAALSGLVFWLFWHFIIEPYLPWDMTLSNWEDFLIVGLGFAVGWFMPTSKWRGNCGDEA